MSFILTMTELSKNKISIDELLQKVRLELLKTPGYNPPSNSSISVANPIIAEDIGYIESSINNAEFRTNVRTKWPDQYNRFPFNLSKKFQKIALKVLQIIFVDQREVNFSLIQALKKSTLVNQQLIEEIIELKAQVRTFEEQLVDLLNQYNCDSEESVKLLEQHFNGAATKIEELSDRSTTNNTQIEELSDRYITSNTQIETLNQQTHNLHKQYLHDYSYLKNDLSQQKRLTALFLEEARQRLPEKLNQQQIQNFTNEEQHLLDAFYVAFEEQFRGSWEEVTQKLKVHLPWIESAKVGTQESPILDLGCGRGEWLELLKVSGFVARGLDINRVMVEQCQARGLDIVEGDALTYLQSLPTASLGAVTGFHIIEHLPFNLLVKLLNETNRVLTSGGIAIFETPNPDNVLVGSSSFYLDPTHQKPLPSQTIKFVVEFCDFCNVQILNLNLSDLPKVSDDSEIAQRFNDYFYGYRDYAVVGFKS